MDYVIKNKPDGTECKQSSEEESSPYSEYNGPHAWSSCTWSSCTWSSCMVLMHMVLMHMVLMHGPHAWSSCMVLMHGPLH